MEIAALILNTIFGLINLIVGGINIYGFYENRRIKNLEIAKSLRLIDIQEDEIKKKYIRLRGEKENEMAARGLSSSGIKDSEMQRFSDEEQREQKKLNAERDYLLKTTRK